VIINHPIIHKPCNYTNLLLTSIQTFSDIAVSWTSLHLVFLVCFFFYINLCWSCVSGINLPFFGLFMPLLPTVYTCLFIVLYLWYVKLIIIIIIMQLRYQSLLHVATSSRPPAHPEIPEILFLVSKFPTTNTFVLKIPKCRQN